MPDSDASPSVPLTCTRCGAALAKHEACQRCLLDFSSTPQPSEEGGQRSWLDGLDANAEQDGGYEILGELGRGGMGLVYRARHRALHRVVALKMILPQQLRSPAVLQRFRAEAEAVAALDHPGILPIYEVGELDGNPYFSMKLAEGGNLGQQIGRWRERPRSAAQLIAQVARAIHHAHERNILHRDLKPGNILLGKDGEPYVTDFGIAKWLDRDHGLTLDAAALGTPHYIAPEQAAGESSRLTPAADTYSLGAILYELISGRPPFVANTPLETLRLVTDAAPASPRTLNPTVPRELESICLKCLEKEPGARYSSAIALAEDLERWLDGHPTAVRPPSLSSRAGRWTKRNRVLAGLSAAFAIALGVIAILGYRRATTESSVTSLPSDNSIAVLPFADSSPAHDQEYFCDGISEEVLTALTKIEGLRVVARGSSFSFKGKAASPTEIGRMLNVANILEGSVRRDGSRIRITAQVLDVRGGFYRWSETYEREVSDVFTVQNQITRSIVDALKIKLGQTLTVPAPRNVEAYDLYLRGLYFSNKSSEGDLRQSLSYFQAALDKDPTFSRAWSGVATVWGWLADEYVRPLEAYPIVKAAALKAISLDERDAEAHVNLGEAIRVLDWDYKAEELELRRALELDPNSASAHLYLALLLASKGYDKETFEHLEAAKRADPLSPIVANFTAEIFLSTNRVDDAVAEGERMVLLDPSYSYFDNGLAVAYREKGELDKAIALYEAAQSATHVPRAGLAITYARAGRDDDARRILAQLIELAKTRYVAADQVASVYVALGNKDEAFRWLDRAIAEHSAPLEGIGRRITFRPLRSDPRFPDVLRRIGLDPAVALSR